MSYRASLTFKPLIGHKACIDYFETDVKKNYKPNKYGYSSGISPEDDDEYYYDVTNGSIDDMCKEIAKKYQGITFYGYGKYDTTTGSWTAYQLLWNNQNGIFFMSDGYSYDDMGHTKVLFDGVSIRGVTYDGEYIDLDPEYHGYNHINEDENDNE